MFEIGNSLREARLRQNLDFTDVEQATKIRGKYLRALEDERFELLPAQTYVKGFLRSYAEFLGLDGQLYVDEFNSRYVTGEEEPPLRPRRSAAAPRRQRRFESNVVLGALVGIGIVTALVIAAWKSSGDQQTTVPLGGAEPRASAASPELVVRAVRGASSLEVRGGSELGRQRFQGTLELGRSQRFTFTRSLWVRIGRPENVVVTLNGERQDVPAWHGGAVLRATRTSVSASRPRA